MKPNHLFPIALVALASLGSPAHATSVERHGTEWRCKGTSFGECKKALCEKLENPCENVCYKADATGSTQCTECDVLDEGEGNYSVHGDQTTCRAAVSLPYDDGDGGSSGGGDEGSGGGESTGGSAGYGELLSRARNTWVLQSSTAWGGDAYRAVDGNYDGNWASGSVTHTDIDGRPEWHIYTGRNLYKSVWIYNRTDCCGERLGGASVWVRNWDEKSETYKWRQVATIGKKGKNPGHEIRISFWGKLRNHYADALAITLPEGSKVPLSLGEVELWGCGYGYSCVE